MNTIFIGCDKKDHITAKDPFPPWHFMYLRETKSERCGEEGEGENVHQFKHPPKISCIFILHIFVLPNFTLFSFIYYINFFFWGGGGWDGIYQKLTFVYEGVKAPSEIYYINYINYIEQ